MRILNNHEFKQLSFPDATVSDMQLLLEEQTLVIQIDSAWLENENLEQTSIVLKNWDTLHIRMYEHEQQQWQDVSTNSLDYLKDICEAELSETEICLRGFGYKMGQWLEYKIQGKQLVIICYTAVQLTLAA